MKHLKLLTNWCPNPLKKALEKQSVKIYYYKSGKSVRQLLNCIDLVDSDIVYYARFVPPMIDRSLLTVKVDTPVIIGLHSPLTIDHPLRPTHFAHDILVPLQVLVYYLNKFHIHTLNTDDLRRCMNIGVKRVFYMPLGTDTNTFKPRQKDNTFTAIYASRASWHKGTDILITIIHMLTKKLNTQIKFRIISYGFLTKLYEKLRHYQNIEILPWMPLQEYTKVLASSHVLLFPSRYESFGLVVLDALAAGVPVVAFSVRGVVRDIMLKDDMLKKHVVNYHDVNTFVKHVIELSRLWYDKPEQYLSLTNKCRRVAKQYSWDNVSKLFARMFRITINSM